MKPFMGPVRQGNGDLTDATKAKDYDSYDYCTHYYDYYGFPVGRLLVHGWPVQLAASRLAGSTVVTGVCPQRAYLRVALLQGLSKNYH